VSYDGEVKVIDFGIAIAESIRSGTEPGTLKGKFFYMSPEMIVGSGVDHRADIFAAGVMLYEQLCNRRPFTGLTATEVVDRIAEGKPRPPRSFDPSCPEALETICLTALARDPAQRFNGLSDFIQAIEGVGGAAELASLTQVSQYVRRIATPTSPPLEPEPPKVATGRSRVPSPLAALTGWRRLHFPRRALALLGVAAAGALGVLYLVLRTPNRVEPAVLLARAEHQPPSRRQEMLHDVVSNPLATESELLSAGLLELSDGDFEGALDASDRLTHGHPTHEEGFLLQGRAEAGLRRGRKAEEAFNLAEARAPKDVRVDIARSELFQAEGDLLKAINAMAQAQAKQPSRTDVAFRRGYLLSQLGELSEAEKTLSALLQKHFDPEAAAELGFVRFRQGHSQEALSLLRKALARGASVQNGEYYLGAVLFSMGDASAAEHAYREADRQNPKDARPMLSLCELQLKTQRADDARKTAQELARRFPDQVARIGAACGR
jgi:tetratricopeptide (TPR) repeat protein